MIEVGDYVTILDEFLHESERGPGRVWLVTDAAGGFFDVRCGVDFINRMDGRALHKLGPLEMLVEGTVEYCCPCFISGLAL